MSTAPELVWVDPKRHDRTGFDCGRPPLNEFLAHRAARNVAVGASRIWMLTDRRAELAAPRWLELLIAFLALSVAGIDRGEFPPRSRSGRPATRCWST